ncbi:amino acid synthesis family protein [Saxibacter everestensis]|uniref:Amino acid synthesis family protein n=1 Tax=Saxibacter everestensis TaxID=2909229 RepID=A0ABY8QS75_9MICO|nr:amino acid synthesis family protein [Brevibacteriaceae bacterium ZFBP1038]
MPSYSRIRYSNQAEDSGFDMTNDYNVRKWVSYREETVHDGGETLETPLIRAAVGVVFANPFAGGFTQDLSALTEPSPWLATELARRGLALLDGRGVESYGKGGIAGVNGEQEHVVACVTTVFGNAFRDAVGGGEAWISSMTKTGAAGTSLDIPLAHKDALYVRSHYDGITLTTADAPRPDELLIAVALATGSRPHERVGGVRANEIQGGGLR